MFVLVLMSHGTGGDMILDSQSQPVALTKIKDLLSPHNFAAMKGKPKLMIVQACSGGKYFTCNIQPTALHRVLNMIVTVVNIVLPVSVHIHLHILSGQFSYTSTYTSVYTLVHLYCIHLWYTSVYTSA